jgi:GT2 family glycosyltransferase
VAGTQSPTVLAVIVLYQCELASSHSFSSLQQIFAEDAALEKELSVVVYDNSPQPLPGPAPAQYVHDPSNGGLAVAYNFALVRAEKQHCKWLLLLDQDTSLTRPFLLELLETIEKVRNQPDIGMVIPKLAVNGVVHSPATPFLEQMRHQFRPGLPPIGREVTGILEKQMCAYNSGSTLRVAALRAMGGFPEDFWLDFLDHAIAQSLSNHGYRTYLMRATLEHQASYADLDKMPLWRLHNVLMAQTLFVKRSGNLKDKLLYRLWLLRYARTLRNGRTDPQAWRQAAVQALLFRNPASRHTRQKDPQGSLQS